MSAFINPRRAAAVEIPATYVYDGSFDGFLCVVFEATRRHERPGAIESESGGGTLVLGPTVEIQTDPERATRVRRGLDRRASEATARMYAAFLSEAPGVESLLFRLVEDVIERGAAALSDWRSEPARETHRLAARTWREVHRMHAFVRFERRAARGGGAPVAAPDGAGDHYVATVRPVPHTLPLLTEHFADRYPTLRWAIVDAGRHLALVHTPVREREEGAPATVIVPAAEIEALEDAPDEAHVQRMWQAYFRAVDIPERKNLDLQRRHVPKRYWGEMTELRGR